MQKQATIGDRRVERLVEQILDVECTVEEACRDCPELLPEVQSRIDRIRRLAADVDAIFPPRPPPLQAGAAAEAKLPRIPGYAIEAVVGRGGMGVVYRARDLKLNRLVALKMLLPGAYAGGVEFVRFMREAQAVAALPHANIVQVHDVGELDGQPYFTMEFVEGGSLSQKLAGTPQRAAHAASMVATLAEAIHTAHRQGIVHRDLKPGNILMTIDATPKISDFGLARYFDRDGAITLSGVRAGTPSYMAPEQALGKTRQTGPPADIYSLGAILYEMLTGRPPFRGETAAETERQLLNEEPVPPSRLNTKTPRDLETICLKCLNKTAERRYGSAVALAEDIRRFQRGEPILARPAGLVERAVKWVRRRPALAAALLGCLVVSVVLFCGTLWIAAARAATAQAVENDLQEAQRLEHDGDWAQANAALERAAGSLQSDPSADLRDRLNAASSDLELARRLDAIGLNRVEIVEGRYAHPFSSADADAAYAKAFSDAGIGNVGDDPQSVAARIRNSSISTALIAALDDWALCATDPNRSQWLFQVTRAADPDPSGWRDRLRDPAVFNDRSALLKLAASAFADHRPARLLVALGQRLKNAGADPTTFLRQVQKEYPGDFWTNFTLGDALRGAGDPEESVRYYQAALAVRPESAIAHGNLGMALIAAGRTDDAIDQFREGIRIDPGFAHGHYSLGLALRSQGKVEEAIVELGEAIRIEKGNADYHYNLALALNEKGNLPEAISQFRQALEIAPRDADASYNLGLALGASGQLDQAVEQFRRTIELQPTNGYAEYNLALILKARGKFDEAIAHLQKSIAIVPDYAYAHYNLALAYEATNRTEDAIAEYEQALKIDPRQADTHYNLALVLKESGRIDDAIPHYQQAIALNPNYALAYGPLGECLLVKGRLKEAQDALEHSVALLSPADPDRPHYFEELQNCNQLLVRQPPASNP
ncbi:MAG TPA: tetratricopeptide repeat protein [Tepidisphaeraceae bacterium]|nr:tetratricopeptide repeat protein [Tepidisphaeraceae bacterium]